MNSSEVFRVNDWIHSELDIGFNFWYKPSDVQCLPEVNGPNVVFVIESHGKCVMQNLLYRFTYFSCNNYVFSEMHFWINS